MHERAPASQLSGESAAGSDNNEVTAKHAAYNFQT